jgi:hypothetical protein
MSENNQANLLTNLKSLVKTYLIHDGQGRIIAAYEAKHDAKVGDPCVLTLYSYRGAATTSIRSRREENSTWDADGQNWDAEIEDIKSSLPNPLVDPNP